MAKHYRLYSKSERRFARLPPGGGAEWDRYNKPFIHESELPRILSLMKRTPGKRWRLLNEHEPTPQ